jgi:hypothetical protein
MHFGKSGKFHFDLAAGIQVLANVAIIAGIVFAIIQIQDYRLRQSVDLTLKFGEYLDGQPYLSISEALDTDDSSVKIFKPQGKFDGRDVDRYLGTFETLGNFYRKNLLSCWMFNNDFSYYIEKIHFNKDVQSYIDENPTWWPNTIYLEKTFLQQNVCQGDN